ncbi:hypothetical protein ASG67_14200 [Sphingomonas sp. Leaf339]|nr:hypothetical protein ASG67_14200 [Sphingomonas sp. Leaf339]
MDMRHGLDDHEVLTDPGTEATVDEPLFDVGGDERRMHVRAYNHWVSLLKGRPFPSIDDLDPGNVADFGAHGVLLDFAGDVRDPGIGYLGSKLRDECRLDGDIVRVADVPGRSLLSRLTDHYLQIIANRAPIGFEAEFISLRGCTTLYRGILMPFAAADGGGIDHIYGVINWKDVADPVVQARLDAELGAAVLAGPRGAGEASAWADGPHADRGTAAIGHADLAMTGSLADALMMARETAAAVRAADTRSRSALYRALGRAHDFSLAADDDRETYLRLVTEAGLTIQPRAPMTPMVKLVFGPDYDKTRLTEFAAVLGHARRHGIAAGRLPTFLDGFEGGIKAIVAAERQARRPASTAPHAPTLGERPVIARLPLAMEAATGEAVVLVARMGADGVLDIVAGIADHDLAARALKTRDRTAVTHKP